MAMEKRLEDLMNAMRTASDVDNLDAATPILMRKSNPAINKTIAFICSTVEPDRMVLPLNVVWFNFDKSSPFYMTALKRVSKDPSEDFNHTWEALYYYDDAMSAQHYDQGDLDSISTAQNVPVATDSVLGVVRTSTEPSGDPVVVLNDDPRLSDPREPLPHDHSEIPAAILEHAAGNITITDGAPEVGSTLIATSATTAEWRKLKDTDLA